MKKINLLVLMLFVSIFISNAQTTIITDDSTYTPLSFNAIMEVHSANGNKGILIPRLTTAERTAISTSATNDISLLVYDTDTETFWYFDGSAWVEIATGGTVTDDQLLTFSNDTLYIENGNSVYLGDYMELPATAVNGQVLTWNGTNWVAQNAASGADNWGTQVVVSDATLTGDGTSGTPLGVVGDLTDDQTLSLNSNTLSISGGNSVDLSGYVNTDNQNLSLSGNTLNITNGTGVDLSAFMDNTDNQTLSLSVNTLSISGGNSVDLSGYGNDWKLTGNAAASSDFIGSTNNTDFKIRTNNTERMTIESNGNVGIGTTSPTSGLHIVKSSSTEPTLTVEHNSNNSTDKAFRVLSQGNENIIFHPNGGGYFMNNIGIGTTSPASKLQVTGGTRIIYSTSPTLYLQNDANSASNYALQIQSQGGTRSWIASNGRGYFADRVGIGTTTPSAKLDVAGHIWQTSTGHSVFLGEDAGPSDDLSDNYNVFIGYNAAYSNTTGNNNIAAGNQALYHNTTGHDNVAIGYWALYHDSDGENNVGIGKYALYQNYGNYNTGVGFAAGAGSSGPTYTRCTFLGYDSDASGSYSNAMALGNTATVTASNRVRVGNTSITRIGGEVSWSTLSDGRVKENINESVVGLDFIMKLRPITYTINKDKEDIILNRVDSSEYSEKYDIEKIKFTGFIAQEVEKAALETGYDFSGVKKPVNDHDLYGLSYSEFVVPIVKAMQEQQKIIQDVKKENELLKKQNKEILQRLENLENK